MKEKEGKQRTAAAPASLHEWPSGIKKTRQRESILALLEEAEKPLSAADIYEQLKKGDESAWLSTVYRTLELFVEKGLAVKISMANNEMAMYEKKRIHHKHYAVCMGCKRILPLYHCPIEAMVPELEEQGFRIMGHSLEVFGYCRDCAKRGIGVHNIETIKPQNH